jgi:hypothetical protein
MIGALAGIGLLGMDAHAPHARGPATCFRYGRGLCGSADGLSMQRTAGAIHLVSNALDVDPKFLFILMPAIVCITSSSTGRISSPSILLCLSR